MGPREDSRQRFRTGSLVGETRQLRQALGGRPPPWTGRGRAATIPVRTPGFGPGLPCAVSVPIEPATVSPLRTGSTAWILAFAAGLVVAVYAGLSGRGGAAAWAAALALAVGLWNHGRVWLRAGRNAPEEVRTVSSWEALSALQDAPVAVLYKHSPTCPVSARAAGHVWRFAQGHPGVPVVQVDVRAARALSARIAEALGVTHESPQVIVLRRGRVETVLNHGGVRADRLREVVVEAGG